MAKRISKRDKADSAHERRVMVLRDAAKKRSADFHAKLAKAMEHVEADIKKNDGLYPLNRGVINPPELCRRAGVRPTTLHAKQHRSTTLVEVKKWLEKLFPRLPKGVKAVRGEVTARADQWKVAYEQVADELHISNLRLDIANERIKELELLVDELRMGVRSQAGNLRLVRHRPKE